jgi:hypothetical protein
MTPGIARTDRKQARQGVVHDHTELCGGREFPRVQRPKNADHAAKFPVPRCQNIARMLQRIATGSCGGNNLLAERRSTPAQHHGDRCGRRARPLRVVVRGSSPGTPIRTRLPSWSPRRPCLHRKARVSAVPHRNLNARWTLASIPPPFARAATQCIIVAWAHQRARVS